VTVEYAYGAPQRIEAVVVSTQHAPEVGDDVLRRDIEQFVIRHICPPELLRDTKVYVNPTGRFVTGGPMGDAGLTGRKIIVDTYGGIARHGGGAFSGKDPSKVDRSAAYAARHLAKNVVAAGLADRFEVQVSYAIGVSRPMSIAFETFGTAHIDEDDLSRLIHRHFDLRPAAIVDRFNLRRPIYLQTAAYGHFGRPDLDLPWERLDVADVLRREAGIAVVKPESAS
jgi:S-adenosylmethionine synthetase